MVMYESECGAYVELKGWTLVDHLVRAKFGDFNAGSILATPRRIVPRTAECDHQN
jgi:hypothetical protein